MSTVPPRAVLSLLFGGAFVMGSAEMLVVGLLDLISADLGVSVPAAGALVSANAIGLALGGPLLAFATTRFDRRSVLLGAIIAFLAATVPQVLGAGFEAFLVLRVLGGAAQGLFIAAAMTIATSVVPSERGGRAMAVVISGFASASALGLPLGTLLGQVAGWRGAYTVVLGAGVVLLVLAPLMVPRVPSVDAAGGGAFGQLRHALSPRVLTVLLIGLLLFAASQSTVTYLVPFLGEVTGIAGAPVGAFLLAYGVATTVGSAVGGRFADQDAGRMLVLCALGVAAALLLLGLLGASPIAAFAAVLGIGLFLMGAAPALQHRVDALSGPGGPLAASLPSSAVNIGIALGSAVGGWTIDLAGIRSLTVAGIVLALIAAGVAAVARVRVGARVGRIGG
ncbi:MAG: MFS transporter [Microbacterium sp.]|nr:MFS transporter [Microbacterium sp.]